VTIRLDDPSLAAALEHFPTGARLTRSVWFRLL